MSAPKDTGIELHFCRDCGISIPIADIESGRANPSLPACSYGLDRCTNRSETSEGGAPTGFAAGAASASSSAAASGGAGSGGLGGGNENGMRLVAAIALLYVVGVTSFLLFRELRRAPPVVNLPTDVAMVGDIHAVENKVDASRNQTKLALEQLKSNDTMQASMLVSQRARLQELSDVVTTNSEAAQQRDMELSRGLLALTRETMGLKTPLGDILKRLDRMGSGAGRDVGGAAAAGTSVGGPKAEGGGMNSGQDAGQVRTAEVDPKARAQAAEFIQQLNDRESSDQTRYNAAVQLGDLGHPSAVQPLLRSLTKDSYDLVRRAAAFSLGLLGKHSIAAIPTLIDGVSKQEEYVGYMCARALSEIAKATLNQTVEFGYDPTMTTRQRREISKKWKAWWEQNKSRVE